MNSWTDIQTDRPKETDIDRPFKKKNRDRGTDRQKCRLVERLTHDQTYRMITAQTHH